MECNSKSVSTRAIQSVYFSTNAKIAADCSLDTSPRALPLVKPGGVIFVSSNAAGRPAESFLSEVEQTVLVAKREILQKHFVPQPPDFPISRSEPAYLKAIWLRIK